MLILTLALVFSCAQYAWAASVSGSEYSPTVSLKEGQSNARENYTLLRDVLARADGNHDFTIRIAAKGTYYLDSDGAALKVRSSKITFTNVAFQNVQSNHLLKLNGCSDCLISDCSFSGFTGSGAYEAVKLEAIYSCSASNWNSPYADPGTAGADNTVCRNITVENCRFQDFPAGIGNGRSPYGSPWNNNIIIRNNTITNTKSYGGITPAIQCYGFVNSDISGNSITGVYSNGILIKGGSAKVRNNTIGTESSPVSYPPIYVTIANSYVRGNPNQKKEETVTSGLIDGNTIYTSFASSTDGAITVHGSTLSSIAQNRINARQSSGIVVSGNSTVTSVNQNVIGNCKLTGIEIASNSRVSNVLSNQVSGYQGLGIHIANHEIKVTTTGNKLCSAQTSGSYYSPTVTLTAGKSHARENYDILREVLTRADGTHDLNIKIAKKGTYYLDSEGGALAFCSRTTLDLNGSRFIRSGKMFNLVQTQSLSGSRSVAGYTAAHDITIKNGTLDGGSSTVAINLVNMGHASKITFSNVTFQNGLGGHLLELNGCKDCLITGCTFTGFKRTGAKSLPEAIQLDISYSGLDWNGVYAEKGTPGADNTVCKNITIEKCKFKDYPSGVGNHHCLYGGPRNSGIVIRKNTFTNTKNYGGKAPAIWCYGFVNSEVSGNKITGNYSTAIAISGGSVKVKNNTIGTKAKPVSYSPIYVTKASSYVKNKNQRKDEKVTGGLVDGNTIYTTYSKSNDGAITVYGSSRLSSISKNKITSKKGNGVTIGAKFTVTNIKSNTIYAAGKSGIYITQSKVTNINSNTIKSCKKTGIDVTSSTTITNVKSNKISACKEYGIRITNRKIKVTVTGNTFKSTPKRLQVLSKGKIQKK